MSKNEQTAAVLATLNSNRSSRKGNRLSTKRTYTIHMEGDLSWVAPPQAIALLSILFGEDEESWSEQGLYDLISEHTEISKKQEPWKIWQYYKKQLLDSGFMSVSD